MEGVTTLPSNRISSYLLFFTVAAAPLPFGSGRPTEIAFWCIILGLAAVFVSVHGLREQHLPLFALAGIVILGYVFVLHEQLAAHPWIAAPHPLWRKTADALGIPIASSASIARNQPFFALGAPLANMLALICSFIVCIDRDRARQLLLVVAWSGAAYALYGIVGYLLDPTHILWREKVAYRDVLTSTFINRNTAAVYFGSCSVLWLLLLSQQLYRRLPSGPILWRDIPRGFLSELPWPLIIPFAMLLLCVAATLMTNSRAGIVLSLAALIIAFVGYFHRDLPRRGGILATLVIGGLIAVVFLQVLGGKVLGRFEVQGLSDEGRFDVYRSTLNMIVDHPWFGTGLGTFAWSFPAYRSANISMRGVWDLAHSTPLELASELGVPLASLIAAIWLIALAILIRGVLVRNRDRSIPVAGLVIALLGLTHSTLDFSLQITGYAVIVFALVGAGLAQSFPSSTKNSARVNLSPD